MEGWAVGGGVDLGRRARWCPVFGALQHLHSGDPQGLRNISLESGTVSEEEGGRE